MLFCRFTFCPPHQHSVDYNIDEEYNDNSSDDDEDDDHYQSFVSFEKELLKEQQQQQQHQEEDQQQQRRREAAAATGGASTEKGEGKKENQGSGDICSTNRNRRERHRIIGSKDITAPDLANQNSRAMGSCSSRVETSRSRRPLCCPNSVSSSRSRTKDHAGAFNDISGNKIRETPSSSSSMINASSRRTSTTTCTTSTSTGSKLATATNLVLGRRRTIMANNHDRHHGHGNNNKKEKDNFMKLEMQQHEERIKQLKHACSWRSAVDPASGRTYYYHLETRETTWDKPLELATGAEREQRLKELQLQKEWFAAMEENVRCSLSKGQLPGNVQPFDPNEPIQTRDWALKRTTSSTSQRSTLDDDDDDEEEYHEDHERSNDYNDDDVDEAEEEQHASNNDAKETKIVLPQKKLSPSSFVKDNDSPQGVSATRTSSTSESSDDGDEERRGEKHCREDSDSAATLPSLATTSCYFGSASSSGGLSFNTTCYDDFAAAAPKKTTTNQIEEDDGSTPTTMKCATSASSSSLSSGGPRRRSGRRSANNSGNKTNNKKKHIRTISSMDDTLLVQLTSSSKNHHYGKRECIERIVPVPTYSAVTTPEKDDGNDEDMDRLWRDAMKANDHSTSNNVGSSLVRRLSKQRATTPQLETIFSGEEHNGWGPRTTSTAVAVVENEIHRNHRSLTPNNALDIFRGPSPSNNDEEGSKSSEAQEEPQRVPTDVSCETLNKNADAVKDKDDDDGVLVASSFECGSISLDDDDDLEDDDDDLDAEVMKFSIAAGEEKTSSSGGRSEQQQQGGCVIVRPKATRVCSTVKSDDAVRADTAPSMTQVAAAAAAAPGGVINPTPVKHATNAKPKLRHLRSRTLTNGASLISLHSSVNNTMTSPDNDKTITCICGVYRAHILESSTMDRRLLDLDIFNDTVSLMSTTNTTNDCTTNQSRPNSCPDLMHEDDDYDDYHNKDDHCNDGSSFVKLCRNHQAPVVSLDEDDDTRFVTIEKYKQERNKEAKKKKNKKNNRKNKVANENGSSVVPSLDDIVNFMKHVFLKGKLESECLITTLVYIERLMLHSRGRIRPHPTNWKSMLLSALLLSSKVLDDLSMWNVDFSKIMKSNIQNYSRPEEQQQQEGERSGESLVSSFPVSLERINTLEVRMLDSMGYHVKVSVSEYGKYYFLLRSMWIRNEQHNLHYQTNISSAGSHGDNTSMNKLLLPQQKQGELASMFELEAKLLEQSSAQYERTLLLASSSSAAAANGSIKNKRRTQSLNEVDYLRAIQHQQQQHPSKLLHQQQNTMFLTAH